MNTEELEKILKECFRTAERDEKKGKKHKGLLLTKLNDKAAEDYIQKAKWIWNCVHFTGKKDMTIKFQKNGFILFTTVL